MNQEPRTSNELLEQGISELTAAGYTVHRESVLQMRNVVRIISAETGRTRKGAITEAAAFTAVEAGGQWHICRKDYKVQS